MGSGASRSNKPPINRNQTRNETLPGNHLSIRPPPPQQSQQEVRQQQPQMVAQLQHTSQQPQQLVWPLPPDHRGRTFRLTVIEPSRYSLAQIKLTLPLGRPEPPEHAVTKVEPNPRDTSDKNWSKKVDSKIVDSAHVQSQLSARFHACYNLTSTQNIDVVKTNLKWNHTQFDARVKRRLGLLSSSVDEMLTLIVEDVQLEHVRLLAYDKERQTEQEELYQGWLQKYIVELNNWRSKELAALQVDLREQHKKINDVSQRHIKRLNEETNRIKLLIIEEEQRLESEQTDKFMAKMFEISKEDSLAYLGSESKTELNLRIQANVGVMAPGQGCTNDPAS